MPARSQLWSQQENSTPGSLSSSRNLGSLVKRTPSSVRNIVTGWPAALAAFTEPEICSRPSYFVTMMPNISPAIVSHLLSNLEYYTTKTLKNKESSVASGFIPDD